jgi:hypothetical protein
VTHQGGCLGAAEIEGRRPRCRRKAEGEGSHPRGHPPLRNSSTSPPVLLTSSTEVAALEKSRYAILSQPWFLGAGFSLLKPS